MNIRAGLCAVAFAIAFVCGDFAQSQDGEMDAAEMQKMFEGYKKLMKPTKHHEQLDKLVGEWDVSASVMGAPAAKGTATMRWVIPGKWLGMEVRIPNMMMGMPLHGFGLMGFDPLKKKHVACYVDNMNTGMQSMEGVVVDPTGAVQVSYGTLDEWMTGEHDKPVKYVTRFPDADTMIFEVWDLGIGEAGKPVIIETFTRKKAAK